MTDIARLGIVTGLPQEGALLRRAFGKAAPPIFCSGADPARVPAGVAELRERGCDLLVSFGFAGGLDPTLMAGDILLAERVVTVGGEVHRADAVARSQLGHALDRFHCRWRGGALAGVDRILATPAAKRSVANETAALAADMESHALAAAAGNLPFVVLRAIVDPAARAIPSSALSALAPDGGIRPLPLITGLLRRPGEIATLLALARDSRRARAALGRGAAALARFAALA
jgi:adenosylhomocysteine nucleosidase